MEKILKCEKVGIKDDFISLGGDSIKVIALIADAKLECLTPSMILEGRTPEIIANIYEQRKSSENTLKHYEIKDK